MTKHRCGPRRHHSSNGAQVSLPLLMLHTESQSPFFPVCSLSFGLISKMCLRKLWLPSRGGLKMRRPRLRDGESLACRHTTGAWPSPSALRPSPQGTAWFMQKQRSLFLQTQAFQRQALSPRDVSSPGRSCRKQMLRGTPSPAVPLTHILCSGQKASFHTTIPLQPPGQPIRKDRHLLLPQAWSSFHRAGSLYCTCCKLLL